MARFSDAEVAALKQSVSIEQLVQSSGVELEKHGSDLIGRCPFHQDKTPSLVVSPDKHLWHCLGACGMGGSVIDWVMQLEGVSFRRAVEWLKDDFGKNNDSQGVDSKRSRRKDKGDSTFAPTSSSVSQVERQWLLGQTIDYYHGVGKQSKRLQDFLQSRGLVHPKLIETFKLGEADFTYPAKLPAKHTKEGKKVRGQLKEIGLLNAYAQEYLKGCLVVPVMDEDGVIGEVYGRRLVPDYKVKKGRPKHLYLPGPHAGVWNIAALKASKEIILCESFIDAMTFWVNGFRNVTSSFGVNGFTDEMLQAFISHGINKVLIAYDRDDGGNLAAEKLAKRLNENGMDCYRILFPKGMDANEYAVKMQPAEKALGLVVRSAEWMSNKISKSENEPPEANISPVVTDSGSSKPTSQTIDYELQTKQHEIIFNFGQDNPRRYRIRGMDKNLSYDRLQVNVMVSNHEHFYADTLNLYSARHFGLYVKHAAIELGAKDEVIKHDLGQVFIQLEAIQAEQIEKTLKPEQSEVELSKREKEEALALLKDKNLMNRILSDFSRCGVVGEEVNKQVAYLAAVSRKLDKPLAVLIQSSSAAGKSSLMEAVLKFFPVEERIQYSAMTGQSLFYMGEHDLKHKVLAIAEEEGAEPAAYALKLLQSEGEITIASTGKDAATGQLRTEEYRVEGPVMLFLTTTAIDIDEELLNRCLVLSVNESRQQTKAIHAIQRQQQTLQGLLRSQDTRHIIKTHQNAQRLLKSFLVANPYAEQLTFLDDKTRMRRDHMKYLTLIRSITLLHQYQREIKTVNHHGKNVQYIEVQPSDIALANQLAHEVLGRTLDELPPQTRRLLKAIYQMVKDKCKREGIHQSDIRFSRKDVRNYTGWGNTQLKVHMGRLSDMEYVLVYRGGRGQSFEYELSYDGAMEVDKPYMMGLIDDKKIMGSDKWSGLKANWSGQTDKQSGVGRGVVGPKSGPGRGKDNENKAIKTNGYDVLAKKGEKSTTKGKVKKLSPAEKTTSPESVCSLAANS